MHSLLSFFFPLRCSLCGGSDNLLPDTFLCVACCGDIRHNVNACSSCAEPVAEWAQHNPQLCGRCLHKAPVYDRCWSPFVYAQPLEWMIQQLKFGEKLHFAPLLSNLMLPQLPLAHYQQHPPDAIIPMPLHNKRLKQRGFNQSQMLVKPLAELLAVPVDSHSAQRLRDTGHQTGKNVRQRQLNMKGAFSFDNKQGYQHVVIFDDVITTGSSVTELCKTIKRAGVNRVDVWSLARAERFSS